MSTEWEKYIEKSPFRAILLRIIADIASDKLETYTIKKLVGHTDLYRIRKGKIRIVFRKCDDGNEIVAVDTRGDIYKQI